MKKILIVVLAIGAVPAAWLAYDSTVTRLPQDTHPGPTPAKKETVSLPGILVETDWLASRLSMDDFVVIDAREKKDYDQGHIPGAISFPVGLTFRKETHHKLPSTQEIEEQFGNAGIDMSRTVVVYDETNFRNAARVFWTLEVHGHQSVALLSGGVAKWALEKRPLSSEAVTPIPRQFVANVLSQKLATKLSTRVAMDDPDTCIVDCRSPDEYGGNESKFPRNGHIPGAINVEWLQNLEKVGDGYTMKSIGQLRKQFEGVTKHKKFVTYCTQGRRASVGYVALRLAGFDVAVYDGSWTEWSADLEMPAEPADNPRNKLFSDTKEK